MELVIAAVGACATLLMVLKALGVAGPHPAAARRPARVPTAGEAAEAWLAAHPLKVRPAAAAANDPADPDAA